MNASEILFRPSSFGEIMSGTAKNWPVDESLTCKRKLIKIAREIKYDRYYSYSNKYTEKGIKMEGDGITLYARLFGNPSYVKNKERITNSYFTGEPDIIQPEETIDIKCAWSLDTFPHLLTDKPDKDYVYQGLGYMDLCGAKRHIVAHCLVNAPLNLIMQAQLRLYYEMNQPTNEDEDYLKALIDIEKNMIFDMAQFRRDNPGHDLYCKEWQFDIPKEERVVRFVIDYDQGAIDKIYQRVRDCRTWMDENLFNQS